MESCGSTGARKPPISRIFSSATVRVDESLGLPRNLSYCLLPQTGIHIGQHVSKNCELCDILLQVVKVHFVQRVRGRVVPLEVPAAVGSYTGTDNSIASDFLLFRGDEYRLKIPLVPPPAVRAVNGRSELRSMVLHLGPQAAVWAEKIAHPKTLVDKLEVKPGQSVVVRGISDANFLAGLETPGKPLPQRRQDDYPSRRDGGDQSLRPGGRESGGFLENAHRAQGINS